MHIHTLENIPMAEIADCFNKAFTNYFIPIKLDEQQFRDKIKSDNILVEHSVGITIGHQLVGFILIAINPQSNIAYNSGTGIIPEFRGQRLTEKMYGYLFPHLEKTGNYDYLLEVICENQKALLIYEALGYSVTKRVNCYKGKVAPPKNTGYPIEVIPLPNDSQIERLWNHKPTYQNSLFCIRNLAERHSAFGVFNEAKLIGYIIFDKNSLRIKQFGISKDFRNKGLGHQLFYEVQKQNRETEILLINIDENDSETNSFLKKIGFSNILQQYEMKLR